MSWGVEDLGYGKRSDIDEMPNDNSWLKHTVITDKKELEILKKIAKFYYDKYLVSGKLMNPESDLIKRILKKEK